MEQMSDLKTENLKKGAAPVNNDDIIDMIQTNMFAEIGCGALEATDRMLNSMDTDHRCQ